MRIAVQTYFQKERGRIERIAESRGFIIDIKRPDFVAVYGGDGTVLTSEFLFCGIPKIVFRKSLIGTHYPSYSLEQAKEILKNISEKNYWIKEYGKASAEARGKTITGLNEVQIHNADPRKAIRFDVSLDGKPLYKNVIGDGIVAATPFGSHAYYMAVGHRPFGTGLRAGFNNTKPRPKPIAVNKNDILSVEIRREMALVLADNQKDFMNLAAGDRVEIKQADGVARFVDVKKQL